MDIPRTAIFTILIAACFAAATSQVWAPAVDTNGEGTLTSISGDAQNGAGRVSIVISDSTLSHFFSVDTQQSAKSAVAAAALLSKANKTRYDVLYDVHANAEVVDGPSGGAAMGLIALAEFTGRKIRGDMAVTGAISADGTLGKVGGITKKVEAAGKAGLKVFVLPAGQSIQDNTDLAESSMQKWGLQVVEARNLGQVAAYAFTPAGAQLTPQDVSLPEITLPAMPADPEADSLEAIAQKSVDDAAAQIPMRGADGTPLSNAASADINLSRKLLAGNYYYSAANSAFVTLVAARTFEYSNYTKPQLEAKAEELSQELDAMEFPAKDEGNFEWATAAELRFYWADARISSARDSISSGGLAQAAGDLAVAGLWADASRQLSAAASAKSAGRGISEDAFRTAVMGRVSDASTAVRDSGDSEAQFHLDMAKTEFSDGAYFAAAYDAAFANAFATAVLQYDGKTADDAMNLVPEPSKYGDYGTPWARQYFAHAIYNKQEWKRSREESYAINALKLVLLASQIDSTAKVLKSGSAPQEAANNSGDGQGNSTGGPVVSVVITPTKQRAWLPDRDTVLAAIGIIIAAFAIVMFAVRNRPARIKREPTTVELEGKLDSLDDLLLEGKISESTYERIRGKYEGRMRDLSAELAGDEDEASGKLRKGGKTPARKQPRMRARRNPR